jgi:hypothetical protein
MGRLHGTICRVLVIDEVLLLVENLSRLRLVSTLCRCSHSIEQTEKNF